jgi:hypothetical protein
VRQILSLAHKKGLIAKTPEVTIRLVQALTTLWETMAGEGYLFVGTKGGPLNGDFFRKEKQSMFL